VVRQSSSVELGTPSEFRTSGFEGPGTPRQNSGLATVQLRGAHSLFRLEPNEKREFEPLPVAVDFAEPDAAKPPKLRLDVEQLV